MDESSRVKPSRGWVLLQPIPISEWMGTNLQLPDSMKDMGAPRALVLAIGPQKYTTFGTPIEYNCKPGDVVMHRTGAAILFGRPVAGQAFMLLQDDQVIAVVEPDKTDTILS